MNNELNNLKLCSPCPIHDQLAERCAGLAAYIVNFESSVMKQSSLLDDQFEIVFQFDDLIPGSLNEYYFLTRCELSLALLRQ